MLLRIVLASTLALLAAAVRAEPPSYERLSELLFPQSRGWPRFEDLPALPRKELNAHLIESLDRGLPQHVHSPGCSFTIRAFVAPDADGILRRLTLGSGGEPQLAYSGSLHCREGDWTLIWPGPRAKTQEARLLPARLLRVQNAPESQATGIESGCCGDPIDTYHLLTFGASGTPTRLKSTSMLTVPKAAKEERGMLKIEREVVLRFAPELLDAHDPDLSAFLDQAAFGNIARKYLGGIEAEQLMRYQDDKGKVWRLVLIGNEHNKRAFYNALPVNVGWIAD
jgi:hypothetical protein